MKKTKIFALLCAFILSFSLFACGKGNNGDKTEPTTPTNSVDPTTPAGDDTPTVPAGDDTPTTGDDTPVTPEEPTKAAEQLRTPAPVANGLTVTWEAIENAVSYVVKVNGEEKTVQETSYTVEGYDIFEIKVKAIGDNKNYTDSDFSVLVTIINEDERTPIDAPIIDKDNALSIYWLPVDDAENYQIYVNGEKYGDPIEDLEFSIAEMNYGKYEISVVAIPSDEALKESETSNIVILEQIDPSDYETRFTLEFHNLNEVFTNDELKLVATLRDKEGADISYIDTTVTYTLVEGNATLSENTLVASETTELSIKATLNINQNIVVFQTITVLEKPVLDLSMELYDKLNKDNNTIQVNMPYDGTLYYVNSDNSLDLNAILDNENVKYVDVTKGLNSINIDFGTPFGALANVYFVLLCEDADRLIGYSTILQKEIPMTLQETHVTTALELHDALEANSEYVILDNDITCEGTWVQVTEFNGILEGNNHKITNMQLSGGATGMIKKLRNKAIIRNITFVDASAVGFNAASNALLASKVEKNAKIQVVNVNFENARMEAKVEGSSRSTAGCLFGEYKYTDDETCSILVKDCYIEYNLILTRTTQTHNLGSIFGCFVSASKNALVIENCMIDVYMTGNYGNPAGIVGQYAADITVKDTFVHAEGCPGASPAASFAVDFASSTSTDYQLTMDNTFFVSYTSTKMASLATLFASFDEVTEESVETLIQLKDFSYADGVLSFKGYNAKAKDKITLETPVVTNEKGVLTWQAIEGATGYAIYIDDEEPIVLVNKTVYDTAKCEFEVGDHTIYVVALGNAYNLIDSPKSNVITITVEPVLLDPIASTTATLNDKTITWTAVEGAVGYTVIVNGVSNEPTGLSFDVSEFGYGEYTITIIVKADGINYIDSLPSNKLVYQNANVVSTLAELTTAITNNDGMISLANDIDLTGYAMPSTTFTGVFEGNGYVLSNLAVTKASSAFFKVLGNGAIVRNVTFKDATIVDAGKIMAVLAAKVNLGAKVLIENVVLDNAIATTSVESSSSSTQGGLFGSCENTNDEDVQVIIRHCYIDYTHNVVRTTKAQSNIGAIFGGFTASATEAIIIEDSYIKFTAIGYVSNAGAIIGNGKANVKISHTVIETIYKNLPEKVGGHNIEAGNNALTGTFVNVIAISDDGTGLKTKAEGITLITSKTAKAEDVNGLKDTAWVYDAETLSVTLTVGKKSYTLMVIGD